MFILSVKRQLALLREKWVAFWRFTTGAGL